MQKTPNSLRLHLGIFGRRNVGKSSLMNQLSEKNISIVSPKMGTTTDPVKKSIEIEPLGPVLLMDTAGLDDVGEQGKLRVTKTRQTIESTDLGILVIEPGLWGDFEEELFRLFQKTSAPLIVAINKTDKQEPDPNIIHQLEKEGISYCRVSALKETGIDTLKHLLIENAPDSWINAPPVLRDLVNPGDIIVQVMPIDVEAPLGRILLPQVAAVREVMDCGAVSIVVKETELNDAIESLMHPPDMVITDSQAFELVGKLTPAESSLTSYSTLFARHKGDLPAYIRGVKTVDNLQDGDKILIAEACIHHPIGNDIGRVQIPAKLQRFTGKNLIFEFLQGKDYPDNLQGYKLVVHCGACVFNRRQVLHRITEAEKQKVAITNYGVLLAYLGNVLPRAIKPFFKVYPELQKYFNGDENEKNRQ
ncbi:MAG: [FeFe] hydrogenase H-cluster maturation GTPase HydF [Vulcanimicrobiota bacterium]